MSLAGLFERSGVSFDAELLNERLKTSKLNSLQCVEPAVISAALARAKGGYNARAFDEFQKGTTFGQRKAASRFPGKCFGDLARKAVLKSVELFRDVVCLIRDDDYRECVHACAKCEDHFRGDSIEIDHMEPEFLQILVAFLDAHVAGWCILPDSETVKEPAYNYGYRSRIKQAHKVDLAETESAYWQRVKKVSAQRWATEGLADRFAAFHNSAAKLQPLCWACHRNKTDASSSSAIVAHPIYIEALGKSKKRKRDEEAIQKLMLEEAALLDTDRIKKLLTGLRKAIVSMEATEIADVLNKVPLELHNVLPMVKTAFRLLEDIRLYDTGGVRIELSPLPTDPHMTRHADISWKD